MKLLLLEDDNILSETLALFLQREGYSVEVALDMQEAESLSFENCYDLYLLDINLPEGSGLELLSALRHAEDNTPTIFITAQLDMDSMAQGFDLGAIDYIKKPFDPEELLIRLKAKFKEASLSCGDILYDPEAGVIRKDKHVVDLGHVNSEVLIMLLTHMGTMVSKEALYACFEHPSSNALRVAIATIKQKLDIDIKNIRAKGYILEEV